MYVLIDKRNLQLRGIFTNKNDVIIQDDKVVTPTCIMQDLNDQTAMLERYDKELPLSSNFGKYEYYYDRADDKFKRTMPSGSQKIFINE